MKKELFIFFLIFFSIFSVRGVLSYSSNNVTASYMWDTSGGVITVNGTQSAGFTLYSDPAGSRTMMFSQSITDGLAERVYVELNNGDYELALGWNIPDVYGIYDFVGSEQIYFTLDNNGTASIPKYLAKPDVPVLTEYGEDIY